MALAVACALALAGCGGEGDAPPGETGQDDAVASPAAPTPTPTSPVGAVPDAPAPPADAPADATPGPEEQPGGAGDEEPARVPVAFTLGAERLAPAEATVPAFLQFELTVDNRSSTRQTVVLRLPGESVELVLDAGERNSVVVAGQRPGRYALEAGEGRDATLVAEAEVVP